MLVNQNHRFELLKTILRWEGRLNNSRVREFFELSSTRASEWIREFRDLHPDWLSWDTTSRSYLATDELYEHRPVDGGVEQDAASLTQYLSLVGISHVTSPLSVTSSVWSAFPDLSVAPPQIFAQTAEAIRLGRRMKLIYRSMSTPNPHERIISPHSLVRAGRRWHVRAFCSTNQQFRDYALGRMDKPAVLKEPCERGAGEDVSWNTLLQVRLIAHPALHQFQRALVEFEYFSEMAARSDCCRAALVNYYIQDVRAAIDTERQCPPEYQLAVENIEELRQWLFPG